ncbi:MAG TPA: Insertion element protein [Actinomycetota bacterium]|nr:Insertion element protein [Actinomycetota bacterium]
MSTPRAVPFYCPFCGEQDIRPADVVGDASTDAPGGAAPWRCASCDRTFALSLLAIGGER